MEVVGVDDLSGGFVENVPEGITFYLVDVKNASSMSALFAKHGPFDYVYHLAAYAAEGLSHFIRSYNYRNNLLGGVELINQAIKHKATTFVFTSSIAVYGSNPQLPLTEKVVPMPEDPYGIAKYSMELDLKVAHEMYGLNYIIFRPHNVYGPNQNIADKYRNVIGIFMNNILNGKPMTVFGDGTQTRCFSFIDDVAPLISRSPLVKSAYNQVFNVGSDQPDNLNDVAKLVAKVMDIKGDAAKPVHLDRRMEVDHAQAWHAKLRCYFKPPPPIALEEGLRKTAEWVRSKTKGFAAVEFDAVEILDKMPKSWTRPTLKQQDSITHTYKDNTRITEDDIKNIKRL
eukprot:TRINITY_DN2314_c2_g1_i2.p1 TRINITY_DN2314_c2_g1~~TRINITY_DN2314_c2_g1_i2.p1  ORF type:complete len:342 (+),score=144.31 TRINITY_DN2314_c2_g1_i2:1-1026(+)